MPQKHTYQTNTQKYQRALGMGVAIAIFIVGTSAGYEVQPGDTLADIAAELDTTVGELTELNDLPNPDLIRIGQVLTVPGEGGPSTHTVSAGETLASIAGTYGTTVSTLVAENALSNPDFLRIGQLLTIPSDSGEVSAGETTTTNSQTHIVAAGDTLASIAIRYGTTVEAIATANGITDAGLIFVGTQLVVSGEAPTPVSSEESSSVHRVAAGETLAGIAIQFDTTVQALVSSNGLENANLIRIGQEIVVPSASWVCPVAGSEYFNDWGFPRSGGRFHQGNDLFAPRGTEVRTPVSGFVELKSGVVGGLQFWLTGDDGNTYIGTHMDGFAEAGQVPAGTVVGYVGDSGNALGSNPHLHFEILTNGSPINPFPILQSNGC